MAVNHDVFPVLDVKELVHSFREQLPEISLTENDFSRPTTERWQVIYTVILGVLTETGHENVLQPSLVTGLDIEYPELYEDAIPHIQLAACMKRVMKACCLDDFSLKDITQPHSRRLQKTMSALINFLYFKTDRMTVYDQIKENNAAKLQMAESIMKENMDVKTEINRIRTEQTDQEPFINDYQEKIKVLLAEWESLGETTSSKRNKLGEMKVATSEQDSKIAELRRLIGEEKEKGTALSKKIVQSPKRMKENMSNMSKRLEELSDKKKRNIARLQELKQMSEKHVDMEKYTDQVLDILTTIKTKSETRKKNVQENDGLKLKYSEIQRKFNDLEVREQQLGRMIQMKEEKLDKLSLANTNRTQSLENTLKMLREEKELIQGKDREDCDSLTQAQAELNEAINLSTSDHQAIMSKGQAAYTKLLEQLEQYHVKIGASLEELQSATHGNDD